MLYLNAYIVGRAYGGPEEGGWWYSVGNPIACIPIVSTHEKGKTYYLDTDGMPKIQDCHTCSGTGEHEEEDPHGHPFMARCEDCGEVPEDCLVVSKQLAQYKAMLSDEASPRHYEELVMAVERKMGAAYPDSKPRYE